jgi:hypothetical protein
MNKSFTVTRTRRSSLDLHRSLFCDAQFARSCLLAAWLIVCSLLLHHLLRSCSLHAYIVAAWSIASTYYWRTCPTTSTCTHPHTTITHIYSIIATCKNIKQARLRAFVQLHFTQTVTKLSRSPSLYHLLLYRHPLSGLQSEQESRQAGRQAGRQDTHTIWEEGGRNKLTNKYQHCPMVCVNTWREWQQTNKHNTTQQRACTRQVQPRRTCVHTWNRTVPIKILRKNTWKQNKLLSSKL